VARKEKGPKRSKRSISGPYIPYGPFQTKGETCAKFDLDRFRNVNLYKLHTNKQTNILLYIKDVYLFILGEPASLVGIATGCGLDGPGILSRWRRGFPHLSRPALGLT
jgi:hypothetical protein